MDNSIEKFLLDSNVNDEIFQGIYQPVKIHKEKYDDRFIVLYTKNCRANCFQQNDYEVAGYYDVRDKCIYDCNYDVEKLLPEESLIKKSSFSSLNEKFLKEIADYIENYSFENEDYLKDIAIEKFNHTEDYRIEHYKKDVRELFIEQENPVIKLEKSYSSSKLTNTDEYYYKNIYVDYLNAPEETIQKYATEIIEDNKEDLGLELLIYYDKIDYLEIIKKNDNHAFDNLYINREMYNSIKNVDAKTLNITIQYNGKNLTFKYDYSTLKRDLANDDLGSNGYGVAYEKVSDFICQNNHTIENKRWNEEFLFSHVTSITYGKKELYHHNVIEKEIEQTQEDIEMEI